jgi:16S rRNA (guanine966-N2)-methyltransferase
MGALGDRVIDARVLDLFAGSGALGLEALSRGATEVVFVERGRSAIRVLEANVASLGAGRSARIVHTDAMRFLDRLRTRAGSPEEEEPGGPPFDLALADPPYDRGFARELLLRMADRPFARELWVEHRSSEAIPSLPGLEQRRYGDTTISILEAPG